ncbi:hypothetical protein [Flavobacterium sp. JP2137]|uniref:hypothetical protein n=1 Tax=Flavobacterium sp. JP2137 TaxID=3414510 RepID=UPI003D2FD4F1
MKLTSIVVLIFMSTLGVYAQQSPMSSKADMESRMELQEYKVDAKLKELDLKEDNLELSKQNVADIINFHKEGVEDFHRTLNYLLVLTGIVITIVTAIGGYFLERYNKRKSLELKKDIDALRMSMQQSVEAISEEANRELELIRAEAKRQMEQFEARIKQL